MPVEERNAVPECLYCECPLMITSNSRPRVPKNTVEDWESLSLDSGQTLPSRDRPLSELSIATCDHPVSIDVVRQRLKGIYVIRLIMIIIIIHASRQARSYTPAGFALFSASSSWGAIRTHSHLPGQNCTQSRDCTRMAVVWARYQCGPCSCSCSCSSSLYVL